MSSRDSKPPRVLSRGDRDRDDRDRRRDRGERRRERERETESHKPVQGPIVLLKRPETKPPSGGAASSSNERKVDSPVLGSSASGAGGGTEVSNKSSAPTLILQRGSKKEKDTEQESTAEKGKLSGPVPVADLLKPAYQFPGGQALKFIDSSMRICPWKSFDYDGNNYAGNMDYLVVTVIGRPNVGKSTILSYLAGNEPFGSRTIFPPRSREEEMQSSIYISSDQIVFIEMSSIYNQAATNELIPLVSQQGVLEVSNVTWNLRLLRWALSISHVILIVSGDVFEPAIFQLMNSAEIIHPMDSALGEGSYPELVYICNKADLELLDKTEDIDEFQNYFTSVTGRTPRIPTNYFVLPHFKYEMEHQRYEDFKNAILEFNRFNRAPFAPDKDGLTKLAPKHTIQEWFQNASRLWDDMNLSNYFSSYVKLLP